MPSTDVKYYMNSSGIESLQDQKCMQKTISQRWGYTREKEGCSVIGSSRVLCSMEAGITAVLPMFWKKSARKCRRKVE